MRSCEPFGTKKCPYQAHQQGAKAGQNHPQEESPGFGSIRLKKLLYVGCCAKSEYRREGQEQESDDLIPEGMQRLDDCRNNVF